MTSTRTLRALPTLVRVGVAESIASRGQLLVWVLTSTLPLVMLALFDSLAHDAPVGRFGEPQIVAYFLVTFVVRQLTSSWASWRISAEIRSGSIASRLVRPLHPLFAYACEIVGAMPMRALVAAPIAGLLLVVVGPSLLTRDSVGWLLAVVAIVGAWLLSTLVSFTIGALAFFIESSGKVMDAWLAAYFVLSGALIPMELFPARLRGALDWLPFRYQIGLPVELLTGAHDHAAAAALLVRQWAFVALAATVALTTWRRGVARFAANGG